MSPEEGSYRVVLIGIEENTEEKKESFCKKISENYSISLPLLKKIIDHCPIILKKNLSLNKAETLAKTLKSFGAIVSVEEEKDFPPIFLEFQEMAPHRVTLESSDLRKTQSGAWNVIGKGKNISDESLNDTWVLIQIFNDLEDLLTFEEAPVPINPIPPGEAFPFKVVFEGSLPINKVSIAFKNASGSPIPAVDRRKKREPETPPLISEEGEGIERESEEQVLGEAPLLRFEEVPREVNSETMEESTDLTMGMLKENIDQAEGELDTLLRNEPSQTVNLYLMEIGKEEDISHESKHSLDNYKDIFQETYLDIPLLEESPQLSEEISTGTIEKEEEFFPWIKDFRNSIETYYQKHCDILSMLFINYQ